MVVAAGALLVGCGPIVYVSQVHQASDAVDNARSLHADQYAPYWWTRATEYLAKAREVAAYADFQGANRFGQLAAESAQKAIEEAKVTVADPSKASTIAPAKGDLAPAKDPAAVAPAKDTP